MSLTDDLRTKEQICADIESLPDFCSIHEFKTAMGFEELENASFTRAVVPLILFLKTDTRREAIKRLLEHIEGKMSENQEQSLVRISSSTLFCMADRGGCDESWIELALHIFARKWKNENVVLLTGSTGAAAAALGGRTIHSVILLGRGNRSCMNDDTAQTVERRESSMSCGSV